MMNWFFLTLGYSGLSPKAPGTAGSFIALLLGVPLLASAGSQTVFLAALLLSAIAVRQINVYETKSASHDDKRIVIDELIGMWIALSIAPGISVGIKNIFEWHNGFAIQALLSFVLFRYFDAVKPSVIGKIDKEVKGGLGVVADDAVAGFIAGILSAVLWHFLIVKFIIPLLS
jgi:phosphatidylglycerophosphatase A